jgi:hypothetical protein
MSFCLQFLANVAICWEWIRRTCNAIRVRVLVPNIIHAGHNMILTPAGYWTPVHGSNAISTTSVGLFYDAVAHRVSASVTPAAWTRWAWIGAVGVNGADYGDFFAELRVERGQRLTPAQAVALAVHQTGRWPGAKLRVTTRMGEEQEVLAATGEPDAAAPSAGVGEGARYPELNYIR